MQLSGTVLRAIEDVLREGEGKPADAALRATLRESGLTPAQKRLVSRSVFALHRWAGWMDAGKPLRGQLELAFSLGDRLDRVTDAELAARALPAWIKDQMEIRPALLRELQAEPRLWLRARPGKGEELAGKLQDCELEETVPDAIWYHGEEDLFLSPEFHQGAFEIQDLSSQIVGLLCAPQPGETWWDACAGEGGKTLHLCDLMQNKGTVWASDTAQWRLDILKRRASRARLFNYRLKLWASQEHLPTKTKFDGVLVDAPCSGVGTWGRNPHARWSTKPEDVAKLAGVQKKILSQAAASVKNGGKLIYSVCTLTFAETTEVTDRFQAEHPAFEPLVLKLAKEPEAQAAPRRSLRPEERHSGGMFIAAWRKE